MRRHYSRIPKFLLIALAVYCLASLAHFAHNAEFLADYPNLPAWFTRSKVYLAWVAVTAVGALGTILFILRLRLIGLLTIAAYATLGFAGLDHYWVAPVSAHSMGMNVTIWFEVAAAGVLLAVTLAMLISSKRQPAPDDD